MVRQASCAANRLAEVAEQIIIPHVQKVFAQKMA
jgi:hypothetical protein